MKRKRAFIVQRVDALLWLFRQKSGILFNRSISNFLQAQVPELFLYAVVKDRSLDLNLGLYYPLSYSAQVDNFKSGDLSPS